LREPIAVPTALAPAAEGDADDIHTQILRTVSEWARGAMLFEGLGDFHHKATMSSAEAQKFFDKGSGSLDCEFRPTFISVAIIPT
jgi:hypothetical protein